TRKYLLRKRVEATLRQQGAAVCRCERYKAALLINVRAGSRKLRLNRKLRLSKGAVRYIWSPNVEKTVTAFTALKSLISRGSSEGLAIDESSLLGPGRDVRGPVATPIRTAVTPVGPEMIEEMVSAYDSRASLIAIARAHCLGKETVRDLLADAGLRIR